MVNHAIFNYVIRRFTKSGDFFPCPRFVAVKVVYEGVKRPSPE